MDNKKLIINWCLITFCGLLTLTIIFFVLLSCFSPISMAKICGDLGFNKLETSFYVKDYEKNNNINSLYKVVINSYNLKDYNNVEKYYEKLETHEKYSEFIDYINENNLKIEATNLTKSALLNEDNYLKNRYVLSLIKNDKLEKAFDYAYQNFVNYKNYTYKNSGNYLFYNLVELKNDDVSLKFLNNYDFDDTLFNTLIDYCDLSIKEFEKGFENFIEEDSVFLLALNTRIKQVYSNIHTLSIELSLDEPSNLFDRVKGVNDISVELLW